MGEHSIRCYHVGFAHTIHSLFTYLIAPMHIESQFNTVRRVKVARYLKKTVFSGGIFFFPGCCIFPDVTFSQCNPWKSIMGCYILVYHWLQHISLRGWYCLKPLSSLRSLLSCSQHCFPKLWVMGKCFLMNALSALEWKNCQEIPVVRTLWGMHRFVT